MSRFEGKTIIVTGAGSGLGQSTSLRYISEGAKVFGVDISTDGLAVTAAQSSVDGAFTPITADVSQRDACFQVVEDVVAAAGRLDILANVAGVLRMNHFTEVTEAEFDLIMGVNLRGTMWMCQAAIPHVIAAEGNIVNVASNAGLMGQAYCTTYCASKAAVVNLTKAMAMEYAKQPVRINCVAPGGMLTPMATGNVFPEGVDFKLVQPYVGFRPLADAVSTADTILFISSSEAFAVHGAVFSVDLGLTAG